jgi:hypothetical protein
VSNIFTLCLPRLIGLLPSDYTGEAGEMNGTLLGLAAFVPLAIAKNSAWMAGVSDTTMSENSTVWAMR